MTATLNKAFEPGLLFSVSTWTRRSFDASEVKIELYAKRVLSGAYVHVYILMKGHLCLRCKVPKSQIWEDEIYLSYYDYGAEFSIYRRRTFVYKTVWLI